MKYLITGAAGQLGFDLVRELEKRGITNYKALTRNELDITDREKVLATISEYNPNVIIHTAAWTAVDKAEEETEKAALVNVIGTKNITDASIEVNAKLFYISTDYVFDGKKEGLYVEEDTPNPKSIYGLTKYKGELEASRNDKHFIVRISWVFGINGNNFIKTMLKLSEKHKEINVVDDQIGTPTYTVDLAKKLIDISNTEKYGTYHINNSGFCSWAEFAEYIFKINSIDTKVNKVTTEEYLKLTGTKQAYRPRNSKLSKQKLVNAGFEMLPTWQDATERFCKELEKEKILVKKK